MSEVKSVREELGEAIEDAAAKRAKAAAIAAENAKEKEPDRTPEDIAKDVEKELKKAAKFAKEENILKAFPLLSSSPFAEEARKYIYWSEEHDSIAVVCYDEDGVGRYTKVREKYEWDKTTTPWTLTNERVKGSKWIKTWGAPAYPFPLSLFWSVFEFHKHIVVCEGEKDALNLNMCGVPSLTLGSTSDASKWGEFDKIPATTVPILLFDNDDAGRKACEKVKAILEAKGIYPLVAKWELLNREAKNKADASDYIAEFGSDNLLGRLVKACGFVPKSKEWRQITGEILPKVRPLKSKNFDEMASALESFAKKVGDERYAKFQIESAELYARLSDDEKAHLGEEYEAADSEKKLQMIKQLDDKYKKQLQMKLVYDFFGRSAMVGFIKHTEADAVKEILELFEDNAIPLFRKYKLFHFYTGTHFQSIEPEQYQNFILDFIDAARVNPKQAYQKKFITEVQGGVMERIRHSVNTELEDKGIINHQGGTIFVSANGKLTHKEHDPKDGITYCLPFAYDPSAKCDMWERFLETSLVTIDGDGREAPDFESIKILQEYVAYCFLPRYVDYFIYLYGLGANGKSVFLAVVEALFDSSATSRLNLVNMKDHQLDALSGKLINIASEIPSGAYLTEQIANLKQMVVGEPIVINPKNRDPYTLRKPPKMLMAGNEELKGGGTDDGLRRRLITIAFDKQIPVSQRIDNLAGKIIENELPGILNWVLEGLERFVSNNYKFTVSKKSEEAKKDYRRRTDHVWAFIEDHFVFGDDGKPTRGANTKISTARLYAIYKGWADKEGVKAVAQKNFTTTLGMETHLNQKVKQLSAKERYFIGFSISKEIENHEEIMEQYTLTPDDYVHIKL